MSRISRDEALRRLRALIEAEDLGPGARLPAERRLAPRLGCSRETLRAALDVLEAEGRVWRHVGQGAFLGPRPAGRPIRDRLVIEASSPRDLMDARLALEPGVAAAAARRADAPALALLRARVAEGRAARDRAACELADDRFHRAVAETAGNPVLVGLLSFLSGARRRTVWQRKWEATYRRLRADEFQTGHSDQHAAVVDAIAAHDPHAAAQAMRRRLETIDGAMRAP
ncbi:MAG: GntR family transcriptional regulator [Rhodobacteraceae bacterium]|nr:GntR family transcriptional regulator [Paracoccaceae bacterium]MBR27445.1 GntR family transcriptional regulator [Paracoccaceae bacterium]